MSVRPGVGGTLLVLLALLPGAVVTASDNAALASEIWRLQLAVLNDLGAKGSSSDDRSDDPRVSPHYLGWPPGAPEPQANDDIRAWIPEPGDDGVKCDDLTLTGFTQSTDTALLFWNTRCADPTDVGGPGFQYASAAVWALSDAGWQLFAHLGRRKPAHEAERYNSESATASFPAFSSGEASPPSPVRALPYAEADLWEAEQEILNARGRNDFRPYLRYASDRYLAWPPNIPTPMNVSTLRRMIDTVTGLENERKTFRLAGYAQTGGTAVVYWHTHRTRTRSGESVDQHNATTGVWSHENGEWRLLGVLSRPKSAQALALRQLQ